MDQLLKTFSKYAIILTVASIYNLTWVYLSSFLITVRSIEDFHSWQHQVGTYAPHLFSLLIGVLLLIDIQKLSRKYYLIPVAGLCYPLLGVTMFLVLSIYDSKRATA